MTASPAAATDVAAAHDWIAAVGRRKTAIARIRLLTNGTGRITVNGKDVNVFFTTPEMRAISISATTAVGQADKVDIDALLRGGGNHAQAEALRHGIARALCTLNPTFRRALKKVGYLTRDPRAKERKKPGLKKARRAPQWAKR
ncbi:30S ribosomal protein S9 [Candidatus Uhrbacteria bacterium]|nr:30S ribosomal protein S9 [Candidatus Uhrbacteria bacterium]